MTHHENHDESQTLCPACEIGPFIRNNYFTGKLMLERDFTDEQRYFIEKARHHHQRLHGWGVVCGLKVKQHANPACRDRFICIEPGTAIDCCGHEIVVREEECMEITRLPSIKALIDKKDDSPHTLQVCLRYRECPTEEIPVLYNECGCDDTRCAPNRILESYDIDVTDVIIDPSTPVSPFHAPLLKWHCTVGPAHASRVSLHSASHLMYVITADNAKTVFQLDTDNYTVVGAHALPEKGLELAVSSDGTRVYIVTEGTGGAGDRQLVVLDTTNNMGNAPISTSTIAQSANNDIFLSVAQAPDNRLFALLGAKGDVLVWPVELNTVSPAPAPSATISLGPNLSGLVIGSKASEGYTVDTTNNAIQVLDIAGKKKGRTIIPSTPQTPFSQPSAVALVSSTAPDMLAVVSESNKQLYLVGLNPDTLVGSVPLDHEPLALTVSPGGHWAYVLEQDGAASFVQAVNLHQIQQKLSPVVGKLFKVGDASQQIIFSDTGAHLYIPFIDDKAKPAVGGVSVLDVSEQACEEILWRHLDGCPQCDMPNCVVLATIENYHVGDKIKDQTDQPADPAADLARIDNRKGRQLLPSTQILLEMIECLKQQGPGGTDTQGPPGTDGLGIDAVQATIIDCEKIPAQPLLTMIGGQRTLELQIPRGCDGIEGDPGIDDIDLKIVPCGTPESGKIDIDALGKRILKLVIPTNCGTDLTHICAISWKHSDPDNFTPRTQQIGANGILVRFDRLIRNGDIHKHSFIVLERQDNENEDVVCWCEMRPKRVGGVQFRRPEECKISDDFRPVDNDPDKLVNGAQFLPSEGFQENGKYRVIIKGDFIRDINGKGVDADHLPPWLPERRNTGDGIEGGTFESWFSVREEG